MEKIYVKPNTYNQTTGGVYAKWNNLNRLSNNNFDSFAETDLIRGYSLTPHTPSKLTLTNFKCNLPVGARVKKIRTVLRWNREYYSGYTKVCDPGTARLTFVGTPNLGYRDVAINDNGAEYHVHNFECDLDASVVNSSGFGINLDFHKNRNNIRGYIRFRIVELQIYYETPSFELVINKVKGNYKNDKFEVAATISNKSGAPWIPTVTITAPLGFVIEEFSSKGNIAHDQVNSPQLLTWTPGLDRISSDTMSIILSTDINFGNSDQYTGSFTIFENYSQKSKTLNVTVQRYMPYDVENIENKTGAIQNEEFVWVWEFSEAEMTQILAESTEGYVEFNYVDLNGDVQFVSVPVGEWPSSNQYECTMIGQSLGFKTIKVGYADDSTVDFHFQQSTINVAPQDADARNVGFLMMPLSEEELARMGGGEIYTAQTWLKIPGNESDVRDWKYNFRLGVFNEGISENISVYEYRDSFGEIEEIVVDSSDYENLSPDEILDNCVWSECPRDPVGFNNLTCTFRYNPDYPLYIIVTGDCTLAENVRSPRFTEPVVSETAYYRGEEPNGIFPIPIKNTLTNTSLNEMILPNFTTANTMVFYDLELDENVGLDSHILRGVEVTGEISGYNMAISSKLVNVGGETRVKSVVLEEEDRFSFGGYGDLWGFKTKDVKSYDWEVHLTPSNTTSEDISFSLDDVLITLYFEEFSDQIVKTYIDGEDISYYGAFLTDLSIPEGMKTNTRYLQITGSDVNDPYSQTLKEKIIEIEFDLGSNCDIKDNTFAIRQFTKLISTTRDKYNRPIPKRIEFSHYPDLYWEYILEEGYTPSIEVGSYTVKVKLTVPSGVAFSKEEIISTNQGYVDGLTYVNPQIILKPFASLINITDVDSGQSFNLGYSDFEDKTIIIECETRKVYSKDTSDNIQDISKYVDMNNDWFRIHGYYNFKCTGCVLQMVRYREKW